MNSGRSSPSTAPPSMSLTLGAQLNNRSLSFGAVMWMAGGNGGTAGGGVAGMGGAFAV